MLVSGITNADDINILLRNNRDAITEGSDDKKTQVLFLVDLLASGAAYDKFKCYDVNDDGSKGGLYNTTGDCPDNEENNAGSCSAGCFDTLNKDHIVNSYFQFNVNYPGYTGTNINTNHIHFTGCFCPNGFEGEDDSVGYIKETINVTPGVTDVRPVIAKIMQQHPDLKYGVMALKDDKTAVQIFPVKARTETEVLALVDPTDTSAGQLYDINFPTLKQPLDAAAVFPTVGGMVSVKGYLSGESSPLTDNCLNTQLVLITNGGWKNDMDTGNSLPPSLYLTTLTASLSHKDGNVKPDCPARVITNVLGINVAENDSANIPLFDGGNLSVAKAMADNGKGIYKNVTSSQIDQTLKNTEIGTGLYNAILDVIDFNREEATALVTPVAPVSITRGYSLSTMYASSFEAKDGVNWPGNITRGDIDSIPASNFDLSHFTLPAAVDRKIKTIVGGSITDLVADSDISQADIDWLKGGATGTDLLGDIIHFRPLPIHYGDLETEPNGVVNDNELYVAVGSNRGLLHMFNKSGVEQWAFLPPQLKPMIKALREDYTAPGHSMINHFYGVDGAPSVFIYDANKDGKIKYSDSDKVYLYFGLRRGGAGYIALDITRPASPNYLDNLWQLGGSALNYGGKPEADIDNSDVEERSDEEISGSRDNGDCPVFKVNVQATGISSFVAGSNTAGYYLIETKEELLPLLESGTYTFDTLYFKEMSGNNATITTENQCIPDITNARDKNENKLTSWEFDAHPAAMGVLNLAGEICYIGSTLNALLSASEMDKHIGVGKASIYEITTLIGFDLSGLPSNITIESARLSFGHVGEGVLADATAIYNDDIVEIYAASDGYFGQYAALDGKSGVSDDCGDETYFNGSAIGTISMGEGIGLGDRTAGGYIEETNSGDLNKIFIDNRYNDDGRNHSWVQFKVRRKNTAVDRNLYWGRSIEGPTAANFEGNGYWNKTASQLHLTWCYTDSTAVGGCKYTEPAGPTLKVEISGGGDVAVVNDETETCEPKLSPCKYITYAVKDVITLTASANAGGVFDRFEGCTVLDQNYPNVCTITLDNGFNNVKVYFVGAPFDLDVTIADASGVKVMAFVGGSTAGYNAVGGYEDIPSGSSVALKAVDIPEDKEVLSWTGFPAVVDPLCGAVKDCIFIMPAENVNITVTFKDKPTNPTVTLISEGVGGTASLTTTQPMESGTKAEISLTVEDGYEFEISDASTCLSGPTPTGSIYTTGDITEDCNVKVVFKFECVDYNASMSTHKKNGRATRASCGTGCADYTLIGSGAIIRVSNYDPYDVKETKSNYFEFGTCP